MKSSLSVVMRSERNSRVKTAISVMARVMTGRAMDRKFSRSPPSDIRTCPWRGKSGQTDTSQAVNTTIATTDAAPNSNARLAPGEVGWVHLLAPKHNGVHHLRPRRRGCRGFALLFGEILEVAASPLWPASGTAVPPGRRRRCRGADAELHHAFVEDEEGHEEEPRQEARNRDRREGEAGQHSVEPVPRAA